MGSSASTSSFEENNWRKIETKGFRSILYNDITMKSVEQHQSVSEIPQEEVQEIYTWRSKLHPDQCVVDLYEYGIKDTGMCSGFSEVYAITERIHLLQNIGSYSKAEAFIILFDLSKAVKALFKKFGPFTPKLDCIGINTDGRAKCWIHQNFSVLEPKEEAIPANSSELATVNNLIRLIDSKVYENVNFPIEYPRNLDFEGVQKYIKEVFKNLSGFKVDRVYLDRTQFSKKHQQLQQSFQKEKKNLILVAEAQKRLKQIEELHRTLSLQQRQFAEKQKMYQMSQKQHLFPIEAQKVNLVNTSESSNKNHPQDHHYIEIKKESEPRAKTNMEREIELVDSMIVMHNERENHKIV